MNATAAFTALTDAKSLKLVCEDDPPAVLEIPLKTIIGTSFDKAACKTQQRYANKLKISILATFV